MVTYTDIIQARETVSESGMRVDHIKLTEESIDELCGDIPVADESDIEMSDDAVGRISSFDVVQADTDIIVTEGGTTVQI